MYTTGTGPLVCGPGYEYYLMEEQVRSCAARIDDLTGRIQQVHAIDWQSAAGQAFRHSLHEHRRAMAELHDDIFQAAASLRRLADSAAALAAVERSGVGG